LLPSLENFLGAQGNQRQPAAWATGIIRRTFYQLFTTRPTAAPFEVLLAANQALRSELEIVPSLTKIYRWLELEPIKLLQDVVQDSSELLAIELTQVFASLFPGEYWPLLDTRYLRLLLPACVATVVRLNLSSGIFDFAHAGDTALFKVDTSGEIHLLTQDQMGPFDAQVLELALQAVKQPGNQIVNVAQAIDTLSALRETNLLNGVRHNYVDEYGHTQPGAGCGVVNGLAALSDYIQIGQGILNPGDQLFLMTDGLTLPLSSPGGDLPTAVQNGLTGWIEALHQGDVQALLKHVQNLIEADPNRSIFPRVKHRDDATALVMTLEKPL
jgi:serine/threonine protein phosphatase PrpC